MDEHEDDPNFFESMPSHEELDISSSIFNFQQPFHTSLFPELNEVVPQEDNINPSPKRLKLSNSSNIVSRTNSVEHVTSDDQQNKTLSHKILRDQRKEYKTWKTKNRTQPQYLYGKSKNGVWSRSKRRQHKRLTLCDQYHDTAPSDLISTMRENIEKDPNISNFEKHKKESGILENTPVDVYKGYWRDDQSFRIGDWVLIYDDNQLRYGIIRYFFVRANETPSIPSFLDQSPVSTNQQLNSSSDSIEDYHNRQRSYRTSTTPNESTTTTTTTSTKSSSSPTSISTPISLRTVVSHSSSKWKKSSFGSKTVPIAISSEPVEDTSPKWAEFRVVFTELLPIVQMPPYSRANFTLGSEMCCSACRIVELIPFT